jgi:tetratricopeptide (TPR) repeat protein
MWTAGLCLALGVGAGCIHQQGTALPAPALNPAAAEVTKADPGPARKPLASTCVAYGNFHLRAATDENRSPAERERLLDTSRRAFQQALTTDPNCLDAYRGLARVYQQLDNHEQAVATYQKAVKANPREASLWFELGMCQARHKDWQPALENLATATNLEPENPTYTNMLAYGLARSGRYDESLACFKKTVSEGQAHYNLARMLHHLKQDEVSKEQLRLALKAKPDLEPARQLLAQLEAPAARPSAAVAPPKAAEQIDFLPDGLLPASLPPKP